jgi:hypothetical protein
LLYSDPEAYESFFNQAQEGWGNRERRSSQLDANKLFEIVPKGVSPAEWERYSPDQKLQYLNQLSYSDPQAYQSFFNQAVEQQRGGK